MVEERETENTGHFPLGFSIFPHCVVVPASSACPPSLPPWHWFSPPEDLLPDFIMVTQWSHNRVRHCDSANRIVVPPSEGLPRSATRIINSPTKRETRSEA